MYTQEAYKTCWAPSLDAELCSGEVIPEKTIGDVSETETTGQQLSEARVEAQEKISSTGPPYLPPQVPDFTLTKLWRCIVILDVS